MTDVIPPAVQVADEDWAARVPASIDLTANGRGTGRNPLNVFRNALSSAEEGVSALG